MNDIHGSFPPADGTTTDHKDSNSSTATGRGRRALKRTALSYCYAFLFPLPAFYLAFHGGKVSSGRLNKKHYYIFSRASFLSVLFLSGVCSLDAEKCDLWTRLLAKMT